MLALEFQNNSEVKSKKVRLKIKCSAATERKAEPMFRKGTLVEVKSDEEGYQGAWYSAVIVDSLANEKFLVQYLNLVTDDETAPLREIVSAQHIRPKPPEVGSGAGFNLLEKVDAWFNEGWWEGVVSRASNGFKYMVYFISNGDNLEFEHSRLRPHLEWIDGKWIKVLPFKWMYLWLSCGILNFFMWCCLILMEKKYIVY